MRLANLHHSNTGGFSFLLESKESNPTGIIGGLLFLPHSSLGTLAKASKKENGPFQSVSASHYFFKKTQSKASTK
jgi:hypothetical protein